MSVKADRRCPRCGAGLGFTPKDGQKVWCPACVLDQAPPRAITPFVVRIGECRHVMSRGDAVPLARAILREVGEQ